MKKKLSYHQGFGPVQAFYKSYARATRLLEEIYNFSISDAIEIFNHDQKRWNRFKKCVWYVNKRLHDFKSTGKDIYTWLAAAYGQKVYGLTQFKAQIDRVMATEFEPGESHGLYCKDPD